MLEIQDALSDYNSAKEELRDTGHSSNSESTDNAHLTVASDRAKSLKKKKRKIADITPNKGGALKKQDLKDSPPISN